MTEDPYKTVEPAPFLWLEQALHATVHIGAMAYGVQLAIAFLAVYNVLHSTKKRYVWQTITFISFIVILSTIYTACNIHFNEMAWIDERNYPGGPLAYQLEQQNQKVQTVGNVASVLLTILADLCMLWRCYVVYHNKWTVIVIPGLVFLAITVLGMFVIVRLADPGASLWASEVVDISVPYWSLSISFNLLITLMITSRILLMRKKIQASLGRQYGSTYTGVAAMMIECAIPYALVSFIFIILYGLKNTASNLFVPLMTMIEGITPLLIILRVSGGQALSKETVATAGEVSFVRFRRGVGRSTESASAPVNSTSAPVVNIEMKTTHESSSEISKMHGVYGISSA
ncbi:hypothetical protein F5146DRAFT_1143193 [Armillaria mellea]|nr:hypothetical protein F5146DRAFT_1143193 [Armillaria mellea]